MGNYLLMTVALFLMLQATAAAGMYRCQTSDGRVTFTDTPVNLSSDCQLIKEESPLKAYSEQPGKSRSSSSQPANTPKQKSAEKATEEPDPGSWTSRASTLVEDYHAAVKRRYRESLMLDKRKAAREISRAKEDKQALLVEVKNSSLTRQQREEVRKILSEIP